MLRVVGVYTTRLADAIAGAVWLSPISATKRLPRK
jgi:hypothetical protein